MKQWMIMATTLAICCCVFLPSAYAWGVAYGRTKVLTVEGEHISFYTSLQNMDDETLEIAISIVEGKDIASVSESQVTLHPNTEKHPVIVEIDIPEDAEEEYDITVRYQVSGTGSISLSDIRELPIHIRVTQQDKPEEEPETEPENNNGHGNNNNGNVQQNNKIIENKNITEQKETVELQENSKPAVPKIEEQKEEKNEKIDIETTQDDSWIWWVIAIIVIIGTVVAIWWFG